MITVFYDGKCGNCLKEIAYYKRISPPDTFIWYDIATDPEPLKGEKFTQSEALMLLHAKDSEGKIHVGVDAFILIWKQLSYWRLLGGVASIPLIRQFLDFVYNRFARWRFRRLDHCKLALKNDNKGDK